VLLLLPLAALAQGSNREGYLLDGRGEFVRSGTPGQCWHTGAWTPALAQEGCDPVPKKAEMAVAVVVAEPAPAPVVQPPRPMPQPVPVPVPVQKMTFSADALFGFDKATLGTQGKQVLDAASAKILAMQVDSVRVVGHADRIGSSAYNQKLSTRRAYAVRDYLAFKGVAQQRVEALGVGETEPVTKAGECVGRKSAKLIACLQPDRRVDVEVQGSATAPR
jgi:OOP family OmpA-OmpF porin